MKMSVGETYIFINIYECMDYISLFVYIFEEFYYTSPFEFHNNFVVIYIVKWILIWSKVSSIPIIIGKNANDYTVSCMFQTAIYAIT